MANSFVINTYTEALKCRRSAAFWATLAGALFIPALLFLMYALRPDTFVPMMKGNPWGQHIERAWKSAAPFLLPMYVILVTSLVAQIEYRNNTWKQVYSTPRSYADIYFSRFIIVQLLIIICFILLNLFILLGGLGAGLIHRGYNFLTTPVPWQRMLLYTSKVYISTLGISAMQYWLSLRFRNYIASTGIGLALIIVSLIILEWEKIMYFPYAYTMLTLMHTIMGRKNITSAHETIVYAWFAGILLLGFLDTATRRERG